MSQKNFFNIRFLFESLRRNYIAPALYLLAWILALIPAYYSLRYASPLYTGNTGSYELVREIQSLLLMLSMFFSIVYAMLTTAFNYSYLFNERSAEFHACLPIKKQTLFLNSYFVSLIPALLISSIICAVFAGLEAQLQLPCSLTFNLWACTCLLNIIQIGLCAFAAALTSSRAMFVLVTAMMQVFAVFFQLMLASCVSHFGYGLVNSMELSSLALTLSPFAKICTDFTFMNMLLYGREVMGSLALYAIASIVAVVISCVLVTLRKVEYVGDGFPFKRLQAVILFAFSLAFGFAFSLIGNAFIEGFNEVLQPGTPMALLTFLVLQVFGSLACYACIESALAKSISILKQRLAHILTLTLLCIIAVVGCFFYAKQASSYIPDADQVSRVSVSEIDFEADSEDEILAALELHQSILDASEAAFSAGATGLGAYDFVDASRSIRYCDTIDEAEGEYSSNQYFNIYLQFEYLLNNGDTVTRCYEIMIDPNKVNDPDSYMYDIVALGDSISMLQRWFD